MKPLVKMKTEKITGGIGRILLTCLFSLRGLKQMLGWLVFSSRIGVLGAVEPSPGCWRGCWGCAWQRGADSADSGTPPAPTAAQAPAWESLGLWRMHWLCACYNLIICLLCEERFLGNTSVTRTATSSISILYP